MRLLLIAAVLSGLVCVPCEARTVQVAFIYTGFFDDDGWNFMHNLGRIKSQEEMSAYLRSRGDSLSTLVFENVSPDGLEALLDQLVADGIDLIVATSFDLAFGAAAAAEKYPNTNFAIIPSAISGPDNLRVGAVTTSHSSHLGAVLAGGNSKKKRIGYIGPFPWSSMQVFVNAIYMGAQYGAGGVMNRTYVEPVVELVVQWAGTFEDPDRERESAERLIALGCDVLVHTVSANTANLVAKEKGIHSIGQFIDLRKQLGESVLTSTAPNYAPHFNLLINQTYEGTFKNRSVGSHSLVLSYLTSSLISYPPSFDASEVSIKRFNEISDRLTSGDYIPECNAIHIDGELVNGDECGFEFFPYPKVMDGLIYDLGFLNLAGDVCGNGTRHTVEITHTPPSYDVICHDCEAGTFSVVENRRLGVKECTKCPAGTFSESAAWECIPCPQGTFSAGEGSTLCTPCPGGLTNTRSGNVDCPVKVQEDNTTLIVALCASFGGFLLIVLPIVAAKVLRDKAKMDELYSEKAIAHRCAVSIADMNLEEVEYIREIRNPSQIIRAFITIVDNLVEYRRYLPLTLLAEKQQETEEEQVEESCSSSHNPAGSKSSMSASGTSRSKTARLATTNIVAVGFTKKDISILVVNIVGFLSSLKSYDSAAREHSKIALELLTHFERMRGASEAFTGDRFVCTFNSVRQLSTHRETCCRTIATLPAVEQATSCRFSSGAASGRTAIGTAGCEKMKRFSFFSAAASWAFALERFCKEVDAPNIVDASLSTETASRFQIRMVDAVMYPKLKDGPLAVYTVVAERDVEEGEWMYQMEDAEKQGGQDAKWNALCAAVSKEDWVVAAENAGDFPEGSCYGRMIECFKKRSFEPVPLRFN